jgi:hypothetical protein
LSGGTVESELTCPIDKPDVAIELTERLFIPYRKRLAHSYVTNDEGVKELRIDYGIKEISFDEERLFPFAERLVRELSFTGEDAVTWGPGYQWDELRPLLEALVAEGILRRGDQVDDPRGGGLVPSRLPSSICPEPRFWNLAECESITRDLTGREVEIGYVETFVGVFRIAHPALDADDRQVGEGNVYPAQLRLDRDTEWRVCQYSGSRYRDESPMNVTALKAMIKHWKPMMVTLLRVRDYLADRLGLARAPWTIGELHTLSCVVLGLPAYQLLRGGGVSPQPPVHPVLSSLFRITDGIRMVTSAMLFSIEHTRRADEPLTAAQLYEHTEQNGTFVGKTGVCAGPKPLVDEFLAIAVDGAPAEGTAGLTLPPEVDELVADLPRAIEYGLLGMQTWGVSLSIWLAMSRAYQALAAAFDTTGGGYAQLRAKLRTHQNVFDRLQITLPYDQDVHLKFYQDAYERSARALRSPVVPPTLAEAIAVGPEQPAHRAAADRLRGLLAERLARPELVGPGTAPAIDELVDVVVLYLREEQAVLASTDRIQAAIDALLDRPRPRRPLGVRDFRVGFLMSPNVHGFPYLFDLLEDELGIRVECSASAIEISDRGTG